MDEVKRWVVDSDVTIAVDVIRCSSTIIAGLQNGAERFIPAVSLKEVREVVRRNPNYISAGERGGAKVRWFNLGNSPTEMSPDVVGGKTVVVTTSNGTPLMRLGIRRSRILLVGGLVNNEACASMAGELASRYSADVKVLIPRTPYGECIEDLYAAGLMVKRLSMMGFRPLWDTARIALLLSEAPRQRMLEEMRSSQSATRVCELGYRDDVEYSLRLNVTSTVPVSRDSWITL